VCALVDLHTKKYLQKKLLQKNLFLPATILSPPLPSAPPPFPPSSTYVHCSCVSAFTRRHVREWGVGVDVPGVAARRYCPFFLHVVCVCVCVVGATVRRFWPYMYVCIYAHACMHRCAWVWVCPVSVYLCGYMCRCIHVYMCSCVYVRIYLCVCLECGERESEREREIEREREREVPALVFPVRGIMYVHICSMYVYDVCI
jgi:hypothetical protein